MMQSNRYGSHHPFLTCVLLSGKQHLPPCVFSIYETGSVYKEEEERLQSCMQRLQTNAMASEIPAKTGLPVFR